MLRALMTFPYAGKTIRMGQEFQPLSEQDARILVLGERAAECAESKGIAVEEAESEHYETKQARRYKRRDMQAER